MTHIIVIVIFTAFAKINNNKIRRRKSPKDFSCKGFSRRFCPAQLNKNFIQIFMWEKYSLKNKKK